MGVRNKRPDLNGFLVIDKPLGWSSARVCNHVRRQTRGAKVGHGGTLDPLATGVLVLCLGRATKQAATVVAGEKHYQARIDLGAFTTTDDAEGERTEIAVPRPPTRDEIEHVLCGKFTGEIMQKPPAFSAIKLGGRRAYALARGTISGKPNGPTGSKEPGEPSNADGASSGVEALAAIDQQIKPKPVTIHAITISAYDWPTLVLTIRCGKGTYIRSLARDLGRALGTGGSLLALRRTRVGQFTIDEAQPLDDLPSDINKSDLISI